MIISCSLNVGLFGNVDEGSSRLGNNNIEKIKVFNHKGKIDNIPCHTICILKCCTCCYYRKMNIQKNV